jgi:hypothetical protein
MEDWNALATALRTLHATLLRRARADYMRQQGLADDAIGPGELLMLATRDDSFAWLRSLSELMTEIDELRDHAEVAQDRTLRSAVRAAVEELLANPGDESKRTPFQEHYWRHVHDAPEVTMAHAAVRQALQSWPDAHPSGRAAMTAHRERLAKKQRG